MHWADFSFTRLLVAAAVLLYNCSELQSSPDMGIHAMNAHTSINANTCVLSAMMPLCLLCLC
jgi:hypothetical protein